ncbi:MAG: hypothetical protein QM739_15890 [Propionivibrio sp.]
MSGNALGLNRRECDRIALAPGQTRIAMGLRIEGREFEPVVGQCLRVVVGQPADVGRRECLPTFQVFARFQPDFGVVVIRAGWWGEAERRDLFAVGNGCFARHPKIEDQSADRAFAYRLAGVIGSACLIGVGPDRDHAAVGARPDVELDPAVNRQRRPRANREDRYVVIRTLRPGLRLRPLNREWLRRTLGVEDPQIVEPGGHGVEIDFSRHCEPDDALLAADLQGQREGIVGWRIAFRRRAGRWRQGDGQNECQGEGLKEGLMEGGASSHRGQSFSVLDSEGNGAR